VVLTPILFCWRTVLLWSGWLCESPAAADSLTAAVERHARGAGFDLERCAASNYFE